MPVEDFPTRPQDAPADSDTYRRWIDALRNRQNINAQQALTSVASGDEVMIFDVSETGQVKTKKITKDNLVRNVIGTNTNDNAASGYVGEYIEATGSGVSMTDNVSAVIASVSLTAGDWDVFGYVQFTPGATTSVTDLAGGSDTGAGITAESFRLFSTAYVPNNNLRQSIPTRRYSFASTTTVNLIALSRFTISTMSGGGRISARRVR